MDNYGPNGDGDIPPLEVLQANKTIKVMVLFAPQDLIKWGFATIVPTSGQE